MSYDSLRRQDPQIYAALRGELQRQRDHIELIASENFVSEAVMEAMGSPLTNKYAEGYPGARYYGGCEWVDEAERLAIARAKELFGAQHANVQPHAGAQANLAVYAALLQPGDTILGLDLSHGGHLTHGSRASVSGKYFNACFYGVERETERLDYDAVLRRAKECRPRLIIAGASAYPRIIDFARMRAIADEVGAYLLVDMAHIAGLVAAGEHPSPVPYADVVTTTTHKTLRGPRGGMILCKAEHAKAVDKAIFPGIQGGPLMHIIAAKAVCFKEAMEPEFKTYQAQIIKNTKALEEAFTAQKVPMVSGGTDNHLLLLDFSDMDITGKQVETLLGQANITVNKNMVPKDRRKPNETSGIRIGTAALTTRGMKEADMALIARLITRIIEEKEAAIPQVLAEVEKLTKAHPLFV